MLSRTIVAHTPEGSRFYRLEDGSIPTVVPSVPVSHKRAKARKDYRCADCRREIKKGQTYIRTVTGDEGVRCLKCKVPEREPTLEDARKGICPYPSYSYYASTDGKSPPVVMWIRKVGGLVSYEHPPVPKT